MRKFNMKKARVLYRKGIHNFEPRTPYEMGGRLYYKDSGEALPCPPYCAGQLFNPEQFQNLQDQSRGRQFYNTGIKKGINLGGNADMKNFYINPGEDYINTTPGAVDANLKRINQMYLSNNRQMPELNPTDRKNILDEMNKRSFDFQSSDDKIIDKYFKSIKRNSGYMTAQLGKQFYPEYEEERAIKNQRDQFTNQNINNMLNERLGDYYKADDQFEINQNINNMLNRELLDSYKTPPKLKQTTEEGMQDYLNPEVLRNYMDRQAKEDTDFYNSFYEAPHKKYENPFFKYPRKKGQLGTEVEPTNSLPTDYKVDPFKNNQSNYSGQDYINDAYNRVYNVKYDMQGKPIEPTTPFENDPFSEQWVDYNKALKDYYYNLENDPNNYSHMKKGLRPKMKKPMRGYGGFLNEMRYGR